MPSDDETEVHHFKDIIKPEEYECMRAVKGEEMSMPSPWRHVVLLASACSLAGAFIMPVFGVLTAFPYIGSAPAAGWPRRLAIEAMIGATIGGTTGLVTLTLYMVWTRPTE